MNWKATDTLRRKMLRPVFAETISWNAAFLWSLYLKSICNRQNFKGQHSMTAVPICPQDVNTWVWGTVQGHGHTVSRPLVYLSGILLTLQTSTVQCRFLREPLPGTRLGDHSMEGLQWACHRGTFRATWSPHLRAARSPLHPQAQILDGLQTH